VKCKQTAAEDSADLPGKDKAAVCLGRLGRGGRGIAVRVQGTSLPCTCNEVFTAAKWLMIKEIAELEIGIWSALI